MIQNRGLQLIVNKIEKDRIYFENLNDIEDDKQEERNLKLI